jgi:hypothetical protein
MEGYIRAGSALRYRQRRLGSHPPELIGHSMRVPCFCFLFSPRYTATSDRNTDR